MKLGSCLRYSLVIIITVVYFILTYVQLKIIHNQYDTTDSYIKLLNNTLTDILVERQNVIKIFHSRFQSQPFTSPKVPTYSNNVMTTPQPVISHVNQNSVVATKLSIPKTEVQNKNRTLRAIVFTMDSISQYEENSKSGGAAGELLVRYSLQEALQTLNIIVEVKRSDAEFEASVPSKYDFIILDPWTWAGPGWIPKKCIRGQDNKIFILDFFGSEKLRGSGLRISKDRILTAFGSPWNTFLGYVSGPSPAPKEKRLQGVIWGKDPKHFEGKESLLRAVAAKVTLLSTATHGVFDHPNIQWRGHQTPQGWSQILSESRFLLGMGHPLLGPSAIDAISAGCMYINPIYDKPHRDIYLSQHPFAATAIGPPYVCSARLSNVSAIMECVEKAMTIKLDPIVPKQFSKEAHLERVRKIFLG